MIRAALRSTWAIPLALACASSVGLACALAGDGVADWAAWVGLGLPVAAVAWALHAQRR